MRNKKTILSSLLITALILTGCVFSSEKPINREILGTQTSNIEIKFYSDLQCPACASASSFLDELLVKYKDQIKITYHHYPLEQIHQNAFKAAVAAECAGKQGSFWKFVKYVYKNQQELDPQSLKKHALNLGLDTAKFDQCLDNQETASIVKADLREAVALKLEGTPTFGVNGKFLPLGAKSEEIFQAIDAALAGNPWGK